MCPAHLRGGGLGPPPAFDERHRVGVPMAWYCRRMSCPAMPRRARARKYNRGTTNDKSFRVTSNSARIRIRSRIRSESDVAWREARVNEEVPMCRSARGKDGHVSPRLGAASRQPGRRTKRTICRHSCHAPTSVKLDISRTLSPCRSSSKLVRPRLPVHAPVRSRSARHWNSFYCETCPLFSQDCVCTQ